MLTWEWEQIQELNSKNGWSVVDHGPLIPSVSSFELKRNKDYSLSLHTTSPAPMGYMPVRGVPGEVRTVTERVEFRRHDGATATAFGVHPGSYTGKFGGQKNEYEEHSSVNHVAIKFEDVDPYFTIDWLCNCPHNLHYSGTIQTDVTTTTSRKFGEGAASAEVSSNSKRSFRASQSVTIRVGAVDVIFCLDSSKKLDHIDRAGFILYIGAVSKKQREAIRSALSFALGRHMVYMGFSEFDRDWNEISNEIRDTETLQGMAYALPTVLPVPLSDQFLHGVDAPRVQRLVQQLSEAYEPLGLDQTFWAYWYAVSANSVIAPVHFGALIEAFQRTCASVRFPHLSKTILPESEWDRLRKPLIAILDTENSSQKEFAILRNKINGMNSLPVSLI